MNVFLKGAFGYGNFGDDALMVAALRALQGRLPQVKFSVVADEERYLARLIPGVRIISRDREREFTSDVLLFAGGTQFYSFPLTSGRRPPLARKLSPHILRPHRLPALLLRRARRTLLAGRNRNRWTAAWGIGLGPFLGAPRVQEEARQLLRKMAYIAVRDSESLRLSREWETPAILGADLCFLPGVYPGGTSAPAREWKRVGLIVRDWPHTREGNAYCERLIEVARCLRARGKAVQFILFTPDKDSTWQARLQRAGEVPLGWNPNVQAIPEFLTLLHGFDGLISARYHGAIFAALLQKPVICIGLEQKLDLVAKLFGPRASGLWRYPFSVKECLSEVARLEHEFCVDDLQQTVREQSALASQSLEELAQHLEYLQAQPSAARRNVTGISEMIPAA